MDQYVLIICNSFAVEPALSDRKLMGKCSQKQGAAQNKHEILEFWATDVNY